MNTPTKQPAKAVLRLIVTCMSIAGLSSLAVTGFYVRRADQLKFHAESLRLAYSDQEEDAAQAASFLMRVARSNAKEHSEFLNVIDSIPVGSLRIGRELVSFNPKIALCYYEHRCVTIGKKYASINKQSAYLLANLDTAEIIDCLAVDGDPTAWKDIDGNWSIRCHHSGKSFAYDILDSGFAEPRVKEIETAAEQMDEREPIMP